MFSCCFTSSSSNNNNDNNAAAAATDSLDNSAIVEKDLKDDNKDNKDFEDNKYNPDQKLPLSDNVDDNDEEFTLFDLQEKVDKMNLATTENGAVCFTSSLDICLDLFFMVVPGIHSEKLQTLLTNSWSTNPLLTLKLVFQIGDVRDGKNDRYNFILALTWLHINNPDVLHKNVHLIPEFTCWKDLFILLMAAEEQKNEDDDDKNNETHTIPVSLLLKSASKSSKISFSRAKEHSSSPSSSVAILRQAIISIICQTLKEDLQKMKDSKHISLCSKWCPTLHKAVDKKTKLNKDIALTFYELPLDSPLQDRILAQQNLQRHVLAPLRSYSKVTEVKMSSRRWDTIQYEEVHSLCMKRSSVVFRRRDEERFQKYLEQVSAGEKKITANALLPHHIISPYLQNYHSSFDEVIELQWQRYLTDLRKSNALGDCVAICDVSGSMNGTPMEVCIALGILVASLSPADSPFHQKILTFAENPEFESIAKCKTLQESVQKVSGIKWGMNTNFIKSLELILSLAIKNKLSPDRMVKRLLVFSDMQFAEASPNREHDITKPTIHRKMKVKFENNGYKMPEVVYWNLRGDTQAGQLPVTKSDSGVLLMSGYSGQLLKSLLEVGEVDMVGMMEQAVKGDLYSRLSL